MNPETPTPRRVVVKTAKVKDTIVKEARETQVIHKGDPIRPLADFSSGTLQARRKWQDIFKELKERTLQSRMTYPSKLSFRIEGERKSFPGKQK